MDCVGGAFHHLAGKGGAVMDDDDVEGVPI
jgi:hypothetical protein